jgi:Asp-tRNA(Asn)/Glu-tRNA(Gln) amidotransferase A subunit family amidase
VAADDPCWMSAVDLAAAVRAGDLSPVEVTRAVLDRIERVNPAINAFCTVAAERALADAAAAEAAIVRGEPLGALHGVPISFKDLTITAGIRTTFGSRIWEHHVPKEDAPVVARARRAGAIVLGKTNTPEFGCKGVTDNRIFGATRNPWDPTRTPGGSSGGAAAALAAGLGPLAEGSDLAGSVRVPAACCGVVGLKPTLGRVPRYPNLNSWTSFSVIGPMARTVRDAGLLLGVMAGPDERDPMSLPASGEDFARAADGGARGLRVAWTPDLGHAAVEPEIRAVCRSAATAFAALGCSVDEATPPDFEQAEALFMDLTAPMRAAADLHRLAEWGDQMDPILLDRISRAAGMTAVDYERSTHRRTAFTRGVAAFFERYDLLLTPTTAVAPFPLTQQYPTEIAGRPNTSPLGWFPFTYPFAMTGQPAISIPCGVTASGLPVGLQIVGRRFADAVVLRAAAAFEAAHPWSGRRPPV